MAVRTALTRAAIRVGRSSTVTLPSPLHRPRDRGGIGTGTCKYQDREIGPGGLAVEKGKQRVFLGSGNSFLGGSGGHLRRDGPFADVVEIGTGEATTSARSKNGCGQNGVPDRRCQQQKPVFVIFPRARLSY